MMRMRLKNIIIIFLFFGVLSNMMLIQVHAAELELEPKMSSMSNPFKFKFSYTWTSKGQSIESYDVSEKGQIAITFTNNTIGVFDNDMKFLYQLSFESDGVSGVLWKGEKLLFINNRSNTAVLCGEDGQPKEIYEIIGPRNYYQEFVLERVRNQGNYIYYCTNGSSDNIPLVHYDYYTILQRTSKADGEEILYEADTLFDGTFGFKLCVFGYITIYVVAAIITLIYKKSTIINALQKKFYRNKLKK